MLSKCKFKKGDEVMLNEIGLRNDCLSPRKLVVEIGLQNKFHVIEVKNFDVGCYPEGTISLAECCGRACYPKATCTGHPAEGFSLYEGVKL